MDLHIDYEKQPERPLEQIEDPKAEVSFRVDRMKLSKDKSELRYNDFLLLRGIPAAAYDYRLGNRSALEWVIDQYRVSTDPRSGIVNDPNRPDDPKIHPPPHRPGHHRLPRNPASHRHPPLPRFSVLNSAHPPGAPSKLRLGGIHSLACPQISAHSIRLLKTRQLTQTKPLTIKSIPKYPLHPPAIMGVAGKTKKAAMSGAKQRASHAAFGV
jgi:hypothetical protein